MTRVRARGDDCGEEGIAPTSDKPDLSSSPRTYADARVPHPTSRLPAPHPRTIRLNSLKSLDETIDGEKIFVLYIGIRGLRCCEELF